MLPLIIALKEFEILIKVAPDSITVSVIYKFSIYTSRQLSNSNAAAPVPYTIIFEKVKF